MPSIDRNSSTPFYLQIYRQIADGIENGVYPAGVRLPSIRECARELDVSNTTIELAYQRLTAEGYIQARRGSGYTICELATAPKSPFERFSEEYRRDQEELVGAERKRANQAQPEFDFAYDAVDPEIFPLALWASIGREVFLDADAREVCLYNDRQGLRALREQIAHYLSSEHNVNCTAEQVLVMPTARNLVAEIMLLFDSADTTFMMEEPGYDEISRLLAGRGHRIKSLPVFPYPTWDEARHAIEGTRIVFATPACQFPTNRVMPMELRESLVSWAQENDAYLIDDEYGWEFQSGVARTPSLAALDDEGRTITLGTFSNSFTPAACLSYAVLPPRLMMRWQEERRRGHPQMPWQTQAAMALFMEKGHWRTHIRKMRTAMARKRRMLLDALATHLGDAMEVVEGPSSLFVLVQARDGRSERELIKAAERAGVRVYPTSQYWRGEVSADWRYVLIGYAGIPALKIEAGVKALAKAWC